MRLLLSTAQTLLTSAAKEGALTIFQSWCWLSPGEYTSTLHTPFWLCNQSTLSAIWQYLKKEKRKKKREKLSKGYMNRRNKENGRDVRSRSHAFHRDLLWPTQGVFFSLSSHLQPTFSNVYLQGWADGTAPFMLTVRHRNGPVGCPTLLPTIPFLPDFQYTLQTKCDQMDCFTFPLPVLSM